MGESSLRYFEKLYPNSYKTWHLLGKTSQATPIWINHPLIDRIKVSKYPESYDEEDVQIIKNSDIVINTRPQHKIQDWYNYFSCTDETIQMGGINLRHYYSLLDEEERRPKLYRWFDVGLFNPESVGYCRNDVSNVKSNKNIAIQPFCGYGRGLNRSPNVNFWSSLIEKLIDLDFDVHHYGFVNEPVLSSHPKYKNFTHLTFFEQIKAALDSECFIGGDSGFSWVIGAYSHKSIYFVTNWLPNHNRNLLALAPVNINGVNIFYGNNDCYPNFEDIICHIY